MNPLAIVNRAIEACCFLLFIAAGIAIIIGGFGP